MVRTAYEAFSNQLSGDHKGVDAVVGVFGRVFELSKGTYKIAELHDVLASDKHVVSLHTSEAKKGRKTYRFHEVLVFHVSRRKITAAWEHPGDQYAIDQYFS